VTLTFVVGRYAVPFESDGDDPMPLAWDREGKPIYTYQRPAAPLEVAAERGDEEPVCL
jgi:hypothetical protein